MAMAADMVGEGKVGGIRGMAAKLVLSRMLQVVSDGFPFLHRHANMFSLSRLHFSCPSAFKGKPAATREDTARALNWWILLAQKLIPRLGHRSN